jgi:hypothetical protein
LKDSARGGEILTRARESGKLAELDTYFQKANQGKSLSDYVYGQTQQAGQVNNAVKWLEGNNVAQRVEAIYHEANGVTDNTTLTNLLQPHPEELPAIKRAWNRGYKRGYGVTFDEMLESELSAELASKLKDLADK